MQSREPCARRRNRRPGPQHLSVCSHENADMTTDLVTGVFGYTGSRIAERLLAGGREVVTLTRRTPGNHPLEASVRRLPYDFADATLRQSLTGIDTAYVTYWMRFPRGNASW